MDTYTSTKVLYFFHLQTRHDISLVFNILVWNTCMATDIPIFDYSYNNWLIFPFHAMFRLSSNEWTCTVWKYKIYSSLTIKNLRRVCIQDTRHSLQNDFHKLYMRFCFSLESFILWQLIIINRMNLVFDEW